MACVAGANLLSDDAAATTVVARWLQEEWDNLMVCKNLSIQLIRHLGIWAATMPLVELALLVLKGVVTNEGLDPTSIVPESLWPGKFKRSFWTLADIPPVQANQMQKECQIALETLGNWLWKIKSDDEAILYDLIFEVKLIFEEVEKVVQKSCFSE